MPDQSRLATPLLARAPPPPARLPGWRGHFANRRSWLLGGFVLLVLAGAATWWSLSGVEEVRYVTQPATRGTVSRAVTATGTVNPVLTIIVGSYVSGVIQELSCDFNTKVTQGQICARIDPRPYQTVVNQDKANLANARAQLDKDRASLAYAKITEQRYATLLKQDSASKDAADNAQNV